MRIMRAVYSERRSNVPSGNRDQEPTITPMDNFVCWRCQSKAPGAFILIGKAAEKCLMEHQHQIELASAGSSLVISQFNGASARGFETAGTNVTRRTAVRNILTKRLRRVRGARLFANC